MAAVLLKKSISKIKDRGQRSRISANEKIQGERVLGSQDGLMLLLKGTAVSPLFRVLLIDNRTCFYYLFNIRKRTKWPREEHL
jgi:hypothetical protein